MFSNIQDVRDRRVAYIFGGMNTNSDLINAVVSGELELPNVSQDRKSTRLNSSHTVISYAGFCLKKKKTKKEEEG